MIRIGTAGWSIPRQVATRFIGEGSHLARYAREFSCAEINTSFYRDHSRDTYARWASATPSGFRFAVKLPQLITHENALRRSRAPLAQFIEQVQGLGNRIGPLLIQLPPSLDFESRVAKTFFALLRECWDGPVACEPRHASWFEDRANDTMHAHRIVRVAADPAAHVDAYEPGGWLPLSRERGGFVYFRLHGSPRKYWSTYSAEYLTKLATQLTCSRAVNAWCIFDNTASGAATANALDLQTRTRPPPG
jgi:uncharacterized protein YecE (DUF72 family)